MAAGFRASRPSSVPDTGPSGRPRRRGWALRQHPPPGEEPRARPPQAPPGRGPHPGPGCRGSQLVWRRREGCAEPLSSFGRFRKAWVQGGRTGLSGMGVGEGSAGPCALQGGGPGHRGAWRGLHSVPQAGPVASPPGSPWSRWHHHFQEGQGVLGLRSCLVCWGEAPSPRRERLGHRLLPAELRAPDTSAATAPAVRTGRVWGPRGRRPPPPQDSWGAGVRRGPGTGPSMGHRSRGVRVRLFLWH